MSYLVGLTGGIGSGKSTVAAMFAAHGVRIIDTDQISHRLTQAGGAAIPPIRRAFGPDLLDNSGALNRSQMRTLVFGDPQQKARLEAILHPLILEQVKREVQSATDAPYTLVIVPLLFESGRYDGWLQHIITVDCPEELQIARTMQRSNLSESAVRAIMAQQHGRKERTSRADGIIRNDGDLAALRTQVDAMHRHLCALAGKSN